jgi:tetratricopeptide (TPR) repeat protein
MNPTTLSLLDQTELVRLALAASAAGDAGTAIAYLKEASGRADGSAAAHYLLGAEYAQIKLYDRAVDEMEAALALDPALSTARLQLGLLWLTGGNAERAAQVFAPLAELAADDALHHFGAGLCALIADRADVALAQLRAGLALNQSNPALNGDMQRIIDEVTRLRANAVPEQAEAAAPAAEASHVLLSAYTGNTSH